MMRGGKHGNVKDVHLARHYEEFDKEPPPFH